MNCGKIFGFQWVSKLCCCRAKHDEDTARKADKTVSVVATSVLIETGDTATGTPSAPLPRQFSRRKEVTAIQRQQDPREYRATPHPKTLQEMVGQVQGRAQTGKEKND
jgi:hypothetical protein